MAVNDRLDESAAEARAPADVGADRQRPTRRARPFAHRLGLVLSVVIGLLGLLGTIYEIGPAGFLTRFDLDGERTVPAALSSVLLAAGAGALLTLGRRGLGLPALAVSALFAFAALDEAFEVHERLERDVGVDWQLLYLPAFVAIALLWTLVLRGLPGVGPSRSLYLTGTAAWAAAQLLEAIQWGGDGPRDGYQVMMVAEEVLEMTGSAALLVAFLDALARRPGQERSAGATSPPA
jgi:hypothetical protein